MKKINPESLLCQLITAYGGGPLSFSPIALLPIFDILASHIQIVWLAHIQRVMTPQSMIANAHLASSNCYLKRGSR